jgi:glutathione S-transferase
MRIIGTRKAPNPRRVRIFLTEKGIEIPFEGIDLMAGDLKTPEFTAINPMQRVPVLLLDDGTASRSRSLFAATLRSCTQSRRFSGAARPAGQTSKCGTVA